jgi:hypothetical protein
MVLRSSLCQWTAWEGKSRGDATGMDAEEIRGLHLNFRSEILKEACARAIQENVTNHG